MTNTIQVYSGEAFDIVHLQEKSINIKDIAHSLSLQCRFGGHCKEFYSVAEHSIRASERMTTDKLFALLHDAAEAYIVDLPRPLKDLIGESYLMRERALERTIFSVFDCSPTAASINELKEIDNKMLATEKRDVMNESKFEWQQNLPDPYTEIIYPMTSLQAEAMFLDYFKFYTYGNKE